jgi:cytochrome b
MESTMAKEKILVWDLPTRVMHWTMALSFVGAFLTAESERYRDVHVMLGYTLIGVIVCRVLWGLIGTRYARFRSFLFGPRAIADYLMSLVQGRPQHYVGHNPAGSVAIYLLLALGVLAGVTGYAAYNGIGGDALSELHEGAANFMLGAVIIHIAGVIVSTFLHRENLVGAMITGRKAGETRQGIRSAHAWLAVVLVAAIVAFWYQGNGDAVASGAPVAHHNHEKIAGESHHQHH